MLTAQRIEHSADDNERTETPSQGKADAPRLERSELPQKPYPPAREPLETARHQSPKRITHFAQWKRWALFALLPIALIIGAYWYVSGGQIMSTDDAYVEADKVGVSTDVSGIVQDVDVIENQQVKAGQILYRLDARQFQIAVENAKANLAQTALMIESLKRDYRRMLSDIDTQRAQVDSIN
jgi:membrane fusion protein, multidrug efflux system